jgi:hypothetical protein
VNSKRRRHGGRVGASVVTDGCRRGWVVTVDTIRYTVELLLDCCVAAWLPQPVL